MGTNQNRFAPAGSVALVAGGTDGLGRDMADALLENGVDVAVCGRHPEKAADLMEKAAACGRRALVIQCDITNSAQVEEMVHTVGRELGPIEILINSAGINRLIPAEDYDEESFSQVLDINVKGMHLVTRLVGKEMMIPAKKGRIINISSAKGTMGAAKDYAAYCASKGAVNMYTKAIACEWGIHGITCNAIAPTFVRTAISERLLGDKVFYDTLVDRIPMHRIGEKEDVTAAAMYLCSNGASFINAQILAVDGGITARQ